MGKPKEPYDSALDTGMHIAAVERCINRVHSNLWDRSRAHDASKLKPPEKAGFDEYTPKLKECTYGSDEYKQFLQELKVILDHHYKYNSHHPEHYEDGVEGMSLMDLVEMLCDWKAASERHDDGNLQDSLEINKKRFNIPEPLQKILENTARELGWI